MTPKVICVTPVKNEAWILDTFLKSASIWADHIIITDQNSTDGSREIIKRYPKATLYEYNSTNHSQIERRALLLEAARNISNGNNNLLIAVDADEVLTPETFSRDTWLKILNCVPGTIFRFQWATILPNSNKYWNGFYLPYGFMDDGSEFRQIHPHHGTRLPAPEGNPIYDVSEFKFIHFQYMNPERNYRRQRWYQCLEIDDPSVAKDAIEIYRKYHYEQMLTNDRIFEIPQSWIDQYNQIGIDLLKIYNENEYWYDEEVRKLFNKYGFNHFKKLDIWSDVFKDNDPRRLIDKLVHFWLRKTQSHYYTKVRKIDNIIRLLLHY